MSKNGGNWYQSEEERLLIAKVNDKLKFSISKNKITNTDFLNITEIGIIKKYLLEEKITNYFFYGGKEDADRSILIFYPEKLNEEMAKKNLDNILQIIRIKLPMDVKFEHREYLSGIMKLGIKRKKFGDILVVQNGADIIVLKEIAEYLKNSLQELTRFRKARIELVSINELEISETKFENLSIIVSSVRLDNFVSELAKCSRTRGIEIIEEGRVFINSILQDKPSKKVNEGDIITIRGKGKFIFDGIERTTKTDRILLNIRKYS